MLRVGLSMGCFTICYTDDILIVVTNSSFKKALVRAKSGVAVIVRAIKDLGLTVSFGKTEMVAFMADDILEACLWI